MQQDALLPHVESGFDHVVVRPENPSFEVNSALLSCHRFVLKQWKRAGVQIWKWNQQ